VIPEELQAHRDAVFVSVDTVFSLRAADLQLTGDQEIRLANMFATEPAMMRRMTFANVAQASRRLIATRPTQVCTNCCPGGAEPAPILRSQHLGWRITFRLLRHRWRPSGMVGTLLLGSESFPARNPQVASKNLERHRRWVSVISGDF